MEDVSRRDISKDVYTTHNVETPNYESHISATVPQTLGMNDSMGISTQPLPPQSIPMGDLEETESEVEHSDVDLVDNSGQAVSKINYPNVGMKIDSRGAAPRTNMPDKTLESKPGEAALAAIPLDDSLLEASDNEGEEEQNSPKPGIYSVSNSHPLPPNPLPLVGFEESWPEDDGEDGEDSAPDINMEIDSGDTKPEVGAPDNSLQIRSEAYVHDAFPIDDDLLGDDSDKEEDRMQAPYKLSTGVDLASPPYQFPGSDPNFGGDFGTGNGQNRIQEKEADTRDNEDSDGNVSRK